MSNMTTLIFTALIVVSVSIQTPSRQIPPAALNSSDEVKQWWEQVRAAGADAAKAVGEKEAILKEKRTRRGPIPDDEDELLSKKDRERLNAEIDTTTAKYLSLLREGKEKGYQVPLPDNRPILLSHAPARYTNAGRDAKAQGIIV